MRWRSAAGSAARRGRPTGCRPRRNGNTPAGRRPPAATTVATTRSRWRGRRTPTTPAARAPSPSGGAALERDDAFDAIVHAVAPHDERTDHWHERHELGVEHRHDAALLHEQPQRHDPRPDCDALPALAHREVVNIE